MATDIIARGIAANAAANLDAFKAQTAEALAGKADLIDGKVPADQLPSYVDDVAEYASLADFPATGEFGKIYVALDTGYTYRWSGSEYIQIGGQDLSVITANFASLYDSSSTYELGDLCIYEDALYVANDDIDPAEPWDPSHWSRTNLADVVDALRAVMEAELATKQDELVSGTNIKTIEGQSLLGSGNIDLTKADVGLGNVDNTSDADKPVSSAQQAALDGKQDTLVSGTNIKTLEGQSLLGSGNIDLTKSDVGLGNVDNTSDADKPVSTAQQAALDLKLNAADYVVDSALSNSSENPVQNKVVKAVLDEKVDVDDTTDFEVSEDQVVGAPLLGSIAIDDDPYNIPKKTSDLQNDSDFLEGEDATELEIRRLFRTEYTITGNITNGTMSGDATIWSAETATATIVPDEGYLLPESVTVTGADFIFDYAEGSVLLSNVVQNVEIVSICPQAPTPPQPGDLNKGDVVLFDILGDGNMHRFKILDINGLTAKLLGLEDVCEEKIYYNTPNTSGDTTGRKATFSDGQLYQDYNSSNVDVYLNNTYYNSLRPLVKNAIIGESKTQSCYYTDAFVSSPSTAYNFETVNHKYCCLTRTAQQILGLRYVTALDIDEIIAYFNLNIGDIVPINDFLDFYYGEHGSANDHWTWLMSANSNATTYSCVFGIYSYPGNISYNDKLPMRPVFKIDLTTIPLVKE